MAEIVPKNAAEALDETRKQTLARALQDLGLSHDASLLLATLHHDGPTTTLALPDSTGLSKPLLSHALRLITTAHPDWIDRRPEKTPHKRGRSTNRITLLKPLDTIAAELATNAHAKIARNLDTVHDLLPRERSPKTKSAGARA